VDAGARAYIKDMIGGADRVLVVLDDDHGIAEIAQALERLEQARVVALMQADRRLVQHVEHAGQARADLRGKPDALALAAGQRAGRARQREIIKPDIDEELQPLADFLEHAHADFILLGIELRGQGGEPFARALHAEIGHLRDVLPRDLDAERLGLEARAMTGLAGHVGEIFLQVLARPLALGFLEAAFEIGDHAFERLLRRVAAQAIIVDELDVVLA